MARALAPGIRLGTGFRPITQELARLMRDTMTCYGTFWSLMDRSSDSLARLPAEAKEAALAALDTRACFGIPYEQGYCLSIYEAQYPGSGWPGKVFQFVVAQKEGRAFVYDVSACALVPLTALIKKLAEAQTFWSWSELPAKVMIGIAAACAASIVALFFVEFPPGAIDPWWIKVGLMTALAVIGGGGLVYPRWETDKGVRQIKERAAQLEPDWA